MNFPLRIVAGGLALLLVGILSGIVAGRVTYRELAPQERREKNARKFAKYRQRLDRALR